MPKDDLPLHIFVPRAWHDWLRDKAHADRIPIAEIVRRALATAHPDLPPREEPDEGRKGGEVEYRPNLRTASAFCDRSGS